MSEKLSDIPQWLERAAASYLGRYPASIAHFRRVLRRKLGRKYTREELAELPLDAWIDGLVQRYRDLGILDDGAYARQLALAQMRRGKPLAVIRHRLREKGVDDGDIEAALSGLAGESGDPELYAILTYCRRRGLGPYRRGRHNDDRDRKDMMKLARAGFAHGLVRRVIAAGNDEQVTELERKAGIGRL